MELRLRSAAAAASWLAQCRRAAVETAQPGGQAGSSGSSGFEPRAGRWAGLPRSVLNVGWPRMVFMVVRVAGRPRSVRYILGELRMRMLRTLHMCTAPCNTLFQVEPVPRGAAPGAAVQPQQPSTPTGDAASP